MPIIVFLHNSTTRPHTISRTLDTRDYEGHQISIRWQGAQHEARSAQRLQNYLLNKNTQVQGEFLAARRMMMTKRGKV
jgi:hypothetical protein